MEKKLDLVWLANELVTLRELERDIERRKAAVREALLPLLKAAGQPVVVGNIVLKLVEVRTIRYASVLAELEREAPGLRETIERLKEKHASTYERIDATELGDS